MAPKVKDEFQLILLLSSCCPCLEMLSHLKMNITFQFCFNLPEKNSKIGASSDCIKFTVITVQVVNSTVFFGGKLQMP